MSPRKKGSAAGASRRRPTSAEEERQSIRSVLSPRHATISLLAAQVASSVAGPDPEAALVYLTELHEVCSEALADIRK